MSTPSRVPSIDVLRGVSLLGILVMNIQSFAMPSAAYLNPSVFGSLEGREGLAWVLGRLLFDFKFISLFSALFGASLVLGGEHTKPRSRLAWLTVFGLVHAYLVWYGDVLFTYGAVGMVAVGARDWPVRRQLGTGLVLLGVQPVLAFAAWASFDELPEALRTVAETHLEGATVSAELAAFRGDWLTQLPVRATLSFEMQTMSLLLETAWRAGGCMLVGMAAVRSRVFDGSVPAWPWAALASAVGLAVTGVGIWLSWSSGFDARTYFLAQALHEIGSVPLAAGIGLAVIALAHAHAAHPWAIAIGRLGRMAFTAYLMHSIVGTWVFGGHGLGLFGTVSRWNLFWIPFAAWLLQLALAWRWSQSFRIGPLEALWRGLSRGDFSLGRRS